MTPRDRPSGRTIKTINVTRRDRSPIGVTYWCIGVYKLGPAVCESHRQEISWTSKVFSHHLTFFVD